MKRAGLCILAACALLAVAAGASDDKIVDIPYEKFVLDNGLRVIVHEDDKAPIVAVNVWYHVGSKNEKAGKTGFAHLFEHLMFNGSENHNEDWFKAMGEVGATRLNGTTNNDRTNYFQNVPKTALDMALWMESDRMGHLLGAIDQEKLDEQRGVVQNEKRQGENQPYGRAFTVISENTYPATHPYAHSVIGSLEDLDAASLDDVREWFKTYYGAANAVLAIAGDVKVDEVKTKVEKYFGDIPSGPPVTHFEAWEAPRTGTQRMRMLDRVPQARIYKVWNVSARNHEDSDFLNLAGDILTTGKNSRLYKRLVYEDQIATDVAGFIFEREIGSMFVAWATAQPGGDLEKVEKAFDEEWAKFLADGPTADELDRIRTQQRAGFIRGLQSVGGFGGVSDILAQNEVYAGDPGFHKVKQKRLLTASVEDVHGAAKRWLSDGQFVLEILPFPDHQVAEKGVDRSTGVPEVTEFPAVDFPEIQRAELKNGMKIVLVERNSVPLVEMRMMFDAGYSADINGVTGTANLAMTMLDEGTTSRTSLEINDAMQRLGARLGTNSGLDTSTVLFSSLRENLDEGLEVMADVVLNPSFPQNELDRLKKQQLAGIQREKTQPFTLALRIMPKLMYGEGHPYGLPFTGSGTEESVASITRDHLVDFHKAWMAPNNATLMAVGDITMDELKTRIEKYFGDWKPAKIPAKKVKDVSHQAKTRVYLIDRPDSIQSFILAGHIMPPKSSPDALAIETMNRVLGGGFNARINMNLREDKGWSYGAQSFIIDTAAQRPYIANAPVQTDKTKESVAELMKELTGIIGDRPPSDAEVAQAMSEQTKTLAGRWETYGAVLGSLVEVERFGLSDDYWDTYADNVRALSNEQVTQAAKDHIQPDKLVMVVVGDRAKIEAGLAELELGEIQVIDANGEPVND